MLWLANIVESNQFLTGPSPIGLRHDKGNSGIVIPPPHSHPFCEFAMVLSGKDIQFIGNEQIDRRAGDLFVAGPGLPHWAQGVGVPSSLVAVYFLPSFLLEMGPLGDGLRLLRRFYVGGSIHHHAVRPPAATASKLRRGFYRVIEEFQDHGAGRELRLRAAVAMLLTDFQRWDETRPSSAPPATGHSQWELVQKALRFFQTHYAEPIYASQLVDLLCISESSIKRLFRQTLGIPWGRCLQDYRVRQAMGLLVAGNSSVSEVAVAVGFETLSHFTSTFGAIIGISPKEFATKRRPAQTESATPSDPRAKTLVPTGRPASGRLA